ncbi:MAG TPA: HTH domain-containing protein [Candidatus Saccharimonadales bacterium]|nr:HTH domain-containing protein [Candidatus Saccharimonadales bacterium]
MTQKEIEQKITNILSTIERDREREIISRRFGLFDRRETLEQIGEFLGITRERVRQLEKSILMRMQADAEKGDIPGLSEVESAVHDNLVELGNIARVTKLTDEIIGKESSKIDQSRVAFFATLSPKFSVIPDNDHFHQSVAITEVHDEGTVRKHVNDIIGAIKSLGEPHKIEKIAQHIDHNNPKHVQALSSTSKHLATLNGLWGLIKWPTVNPKNIRDKIYVILKEQGKHMHFSEIADAIKKSEFKRKDVTTQAIHNELIKDGRFVLIGRGVYALKEWGYKKGTVADIIAEVLKEAGEPLHRDEIVKRVLKSRYVKETTILLNLQGKPQFKRTAKATYALAE